ncbi:ABC transporter permease, partial [Candidatus Sumerlaeota bacterium]|nr:ABC transporter permease [Candidatus Sumerlaeota bacterium]
MATLQYILRRLLQAIPLLFGISLLSFFLINLAPGDFLAEQRANPQVSNDFIRHLELQLGLVRPVIDDSTGEIALDPETGEEIYEDTPWWVQYGTWLWNIFRHGDFGYSFSTRQPVWTVIWSRLLNTLWLSVCALTFALVIALPLGIWAAMRQYRWQDALGSFIAFVGLSMPDVFFALLMLIFAKETGLLPLGGMRSVDFDELSFGGKVLDLLHHVAAPAIVLGTARMAVYMRQMRGNLLDVLEADYVRTARAKGLREGTVVVKHATRNAINPIITLFGYSLSGLLSGSILVENVMAWPGLGRTVVQALVAKDLYLVMAAVLMSSVLLIVGNLIA